MKNNLKKLMITVVVMLFIATSCDDTLDINQSPNNPAASTTAFTLPVAQTSIAVMMNLDLGIMTGFLNQYWTQAIQASQYQVYDRYTYNGQQTDEAWLHAYAWALEDLKFVREQAVLDATPNYEAIAMIMSAYTYQILVDVWDDVPFSEALQGKEGNLVPIYDDGKTVYDALIPMIDEAIGKIDASPQAITPGDDDFLFGGNMSGWIRFANTLKLRIYMRQATANASFAQAGVQAMETAGALFLDPDENVMVNFPGGSNNENPLYRGDVSNLGLSGNNINASATAIDAFLAGNDPRVDFYFDAATDGPDAGNQVGIVQGVGVGQAGATEIEENSVPSSINVVGDKSPVYFMTGFEAMFLLAEAKERGWLSGSASDAYNEAVQAAFDFAGESASAAGFTNAGGGYEYPSSGTSSDRLTAIAKQKWMAMCGVMNVESWAETRRNNYFDFSQSTAGTGASLNGSMFPQRALYPPDEIATNPNATPNDNIGNPVWWMQ